MNRFHWVGGAFLSILLLGFSGCLPEDTSVRENGPWVSDEELRATAEPDRLIELASYTFASFDSAREMLEIGLDPQLHQKKFETEECQNLTLVQDRGANALFDRTFDKCESQDLLTSSKTIQFKGLERFDLFYENRQRGEVDALPLELRVSSDRLETKITRGKDFALANIEFEFVATRDRVTPEGIAVFAFSFVQTGDIRQETKNYDENLTLKFEAVGGEFIYDTRLKKVTEFKPSSSRKYPASLDVDYTRYMSRSAKSARKTYYGKLRFDLISQKKEDNPLSFEESQGVETCRAVSGIYDYQYSFKWWNGRMKKVEGKVLSRKGQVEELGSRSTLPSSCGGLNFRTSFATFLL